MIAVKATRPPARLLVRLPARLLAQLPTNYLYDYLLASELWIATTYPYSTLYRLLCHPHLPFQRIDTEEDHRATLLPFQRIGTEDGRRAPLSPSREKQAAPIATRDYRG